MHTPGPTARDPQRAVRPWSHRDADQDAAVLHWQSLVDAGLIGNNPPTPPAVVAQRETNDALFRSIARDRRRLAR